MAEDAWKLLNSADDDLARSSSLQKILSGNSKGKVAQPSTNITTTGRATFLSSLGFTQPINSDQATTQSVSFSALNEAAEDVRRETRAISSTLPHLHDVKDADELSSLLARDISALNDDSPVVRRASLFRITVALFGHDLAMMAEDTSSIVTLTSSSSSSTTTTSSSTTSSFSANATAAASLSSGEPFNDFFSKLLSYFLLPSLINCLTSGDKALLSVFGFTASIGAVIKPDARSSACIA